MRMLSLRWMCGVTKKDKIRNDRERISKVEPVTKQITEKQLKWNGHVTRRHVLSRFLDVPAPGKRWRGRQKTRWKDSCKSDTEKTGQDKM